MDKIYYKEDFCLTEELQLDAVGFELRYFCKGGVHCFYASYRQVFCTAADADDAPAVEEMYKNCHRNEDGSVTVNLKNHNLGTGQLMCEVTLFLEDMAFADGIKKVRYKKVCDVFIVNEVRKPDIVDDGVVIEVNNRRIADDGDYIKFN